MYKSSVKANASTEKLPQDIQKEMQKKTNLDMSGIDVHYHSDLPFKKQMAAYTQNRQIYLGPHMEFALPHEAWHVAQQASGVTNRSHTALEQEADAFSLHQAVPFLSQQNNASYGELMPMWFDKNVLGALIAKQDIEGFLKYLQKVARIGKDAFPAMEELSRMKLSPIFMRVASEHFIQMLRASKSIEPWKELLTNIIKLFLSKGNQPLQFMKHILDVLKHAKLPIDFLSDRELQIYATQLLDMEKPDFKESDQTSPLYVADIDTLASAERMTANYREATIVFSILQEVIQKYPSIYKSIEESDRSKIGVALRSLDPKMMNKAVSELQRVIEFIIVTFARRERRVEDLRKAYELWRAANSDLGVSRAPYLRWIETAKPVSIKKEDTIRTKLKGEDVFNNIPATLLRILIEMEQKVTLPQAGRYFQILHNIIITMMRTREGKTVYGTPPELGEDINTQIFGILNINLPTFATPKNIALLRELISLKQERILYLTVDLRTLLSMNTKKINLPYVQFVYAMMDLMGLFFDYLEELLNLEETPEALVVGIDEEEEEPKKEADDEEEEEPKKKE